MTDKLTVLKNTLCGKSIDELIDVLHIQDQEIITKIYAESSSFLTNTIFEKYRKILLRLYNNLEETHPNSKLVKSINKKIAKKTSFKPSIFRIMDKNLERGKNRSGNNITSKQKRKKADKLKSDFGTKPLNKNITAGKKYERNTQKNHNSILMEIFNKMEKKNMYHLYPLLKASLQELIEILKNHEIPTHQKYILEFSDLEKIEKWLIYQYELKLKPKTISNKTRKKPIKTPKTRQDNSVYDELKKHGIRGRFISIGKIN